MHRGSALEIAIIGSGDYFICKIDDAYITLTPTQTTGDGNTYYYYIPFGSAALRRIDVILNSGYFAGVYTAQTDTVYPAPCRGGRCIIVGDSFVEGLNATGKATSNFVQAFADAMQWDDVWWSGVGGTGYLNDYTGHTRLTYRGRITDWTSYNPDLVLFTGGINDTSLPASSAQMQTEATLLLQQTMAALPDATVAIVSPFINGGPTRQTLAFMNVVAGLKAAATAVGVPYVNILEQPLPTPPQTMHLTQAIGAGLTSFTVDTIPLVQGTYAFPDGTKFVCRSFSNNSAPFQLNTDFGVQTSQANGALITQVGNCLWTGGGNAGSLTGYGSCDVLVSSDGLHPTQAGHVALGQALAAALMNALSPN
jgi:lysophospholipase L1-like esterase